MEVIKFPTDLLDVNCYLVINQGQALVIDPAGIEFAELETVLSQHQATIVGIINTHGHIDHTFGNGELKNYVDAPIMIHEADAEYLTNPELNLSSLVIGREVSEPSADQLLTDNQKIKLGDTELTVIHTPGHSLGSICLKGPDFLISGDTLFRASIGRSDLPGGDPDVLKTSIDRLKELSPELVVYPGHGPQSTIEYELAHNPFMR